MAGLRSALAFSMTTVTLTVIVAPAAAQIAPGVDGRNVTMVTTTTGAFARQPDGSWAELDARGGVAFRFTEKARDQWSVYLNDASRGVDLQLDLFRRKVGYKAFGEAQSDIYDIVAALGPARSAVPQRPARDVNAGPIWNQEDAKMKCPVAAYAVGGRWTGQWRTLPGRGMSICQIEF